MNDLVIVGGGIAGLAAAAWCARDGLRVALVERAAALGGRARTDSRAGHALNQGAHALYRGGPAARGFADLGVAYTGAQPPTGGLLGVARGELHRYPAGLFSMIATDLFGFGAKIDAARVLSRLTRTDPRPLRDVPFGAWLARASSRQDVRDAVASIARVTTYANAPGRASAGATIAQIKRGVSPGVLYLDGGWQTLVDGLERAALAAGARAVRHAQAVAVTRDDRGHASGVIVAGGERIAGRAVLLATGPATARTLLGDPTIGAGLVPVHTACLDLGLSALPRPERLVAFGIDAPTYFSTHSASARLAERGATVHLMKYLDPDAPDAPDAASAEAELEALADRVQPGWRERVVARRFLPALVASNALVAAGERRPAADATNIEGAYLAGDWVGEEGMLADAAIASARAAASLVVRALRGAARSAAPPATMVAS